jgi:hypothetical protein
MTYTTRFCRECSCFVSSPLATCKNCGFEHTRDTRALEEPIRKRNRRGRRAPKRDGWEHLLGTRR